MIDPPDAHGVVFTGKLASQHVYRNAGVGNLLLHPWPGPHLSTLRVRFHGRIPGDLSSTIPAIWTPFEPARKRTIRSTPSISSMQTRPGAVTAPIKEVGTGRTFGGVYFDASARALCRSPHGGPDDLQDCSTRWCIVFQIA